jgi:hypothetical protein
MPYKYFIGYYESILFIPAIPIIKDFDEPTLYQTQNSAMSEIYMGIVGEEFLFIINLSHTY